MIKLPTITYSLSTSLISTPAKKISWYAVSLTSDIIARKGRENNIRKMFEHRSIVFAKCDVKIRELHAFFVHDKMFPFL